MSDYFLIIFCCLLQVTCDYRFENGACVPTRVHTVVVSTQHSEKVTLTALREDVIEKVIKTVIPAKYLDENTKYHINPCGNFVIGGPMGDAGLTGRKIIVDSKFLLFNCDFLFQWFLLT